MKTWHLAAIVTLSVIVTVLVTASALVLLNQPKATNLGTYTNYPNGAGGNYGYYPTPTANPQTTVLQPTPTAAYSQPTILQPTPSQYGGQTGFLNPQGTMTITGAVTSAQNYLVRLNNPDLAARQVEEYSQNFYVQIYERSTGIGAFELVIDKYTGNIYPETGPNTAWNTKYASANSFGFGASTGFGPGFEGEGGMMGGLGGYSGAPYSGTPNALMPVTLSQAAANAQQYINAYYPGTTAGYVTTFYGYYSVQVLQLGKTYGLLSVNGYTGQVWYHNWHGTFIQQLNL